MSEKEKIDMYIANCKTCMLAQAMKTCPICKFNIGLVEETIEIPIVDFEITDEWIENNPDEAMESLWLSTLK